MTHFFTFYSFKGGVGRSMAAANVAYKLASWGRDVLLIDADLESPGLSRFFADEVAANPPQGGTLEFMLEVKSSTWLTSMVSSALYRVRCSSSPSLLIMGSIKDRIFMTMAFSVSCLVRSIFCARTERAVFASVSCLLSCSNLVLCTKRLSRLLLRSSYVFLNSNSVFWVSRARFNE